MPPQGKSGPGTSPRLVSRGIIAAGAAHTAGAQTVHNGDLGKLSCRGQIPADITNILCHRPRDRARRARAAQERTVRNGFLCPLVVLLSGVPAFAAGALVPVTLGRPVPLCEAVHLQGPVASESAMVRTAGFENSPSAPPALYRAQAQPPVDPLFAPPGSPGGPAAPITACPVPACPPTDCPARFWIDGEFLMWWVKSAPTPFGGSTNFGVFPGLRLEAGGWLDPAEKWGLEGSGFFLGRKSNTLGVAAGSIPLPDLLVRAGAAAYEDSQLWGADFNVLYNLYRDSNFHADLIGGFRYLGLQEDLKAYAAGTLALSSGAVEGGTATARLMAQNNFYGGQIGARAGWHFNRWFTDITGKVAIGVTREGLTLQEAARGNDGATDAFQFRRSKSDFAVLPEVNLRVGYDITRNIHAFVGYDFLYISSVARPGNQDLIGLSSVKSSGFWAQGLNFGVEFSY